MLACALCCQITGVDAAHESATAAGTNQQAFHQCVLLLARLPALTVCGLFPCLPLASFLAIVSQTRLAIVDQLGKPIEQKHDLEFP